MALIYRQNVGLTNLLKSARKSTPNRGGDFFNGASAKKIYETVSSKGDSPGPYNY